MDDPSPDVAAIPPGSLQNRRRFLGGAGAAVTAAFLPGCTIFHDEDHSGPEAPRSSPWPAGALPARPFALVLSSGGPRGFVHAGVLCALDELRVRPDFVVGASVGSLVGTVYAAGASGREIAELALDLDPWQLGRLAIGAAERLSGRPIAEWINQFLNGRRIEELPMRFAAVAVRQRGLRPLAFTAGNAGVAVQASCAIPGTFTPVRIQGENYVDPDQVMPLPVRLARSLGAVRILAVDASAHVDRAPPEAARYRDGDLRKQALIAADRAQADLVLHPDFGYWVSFSRDFRSRAIEAGYREALSAGNRIVRLAG